MLDFETDFMVPVFLQLFTAGLGLGDAKNKN